MASAIRNTGFHKFISLCLVSLAPMGLLQQPSVAEMKEHYEKSYAV